MRVPSGLVRPLFRGVGVGLRVFRWLAGVVFWPRLFWLCAIGTRTLLRLAQKKKVSYTFSIRSESVLLHALRASLGTGVRAGVQRWRPDLQWRPL